MVIKSEDLGELIPAAEVARLLGISKGTVWNMERRGDLPPAVRLNARVCRWPRRAIVETLNAKTHTPAT